MCEAGFSTPVCVADCADADNAPHSVILARGPQLSASPELAPQAPRESKGWLLFADKSVAGRPSAGAQLALELRERGDRVIEVIHGAEFRQAGSVFTIRAGNSDDMRRLTDDVRREAPQLTGVVHFWSLDIETTESMTSDTFLSSARLGCVGVLQLVQALAAIDGLGLTVWLVSRIRRSAIALARSKWRNLRFGGSAGSR